MNKFNHYREVLLALVTAMVIITFVYLVTGRMFEEKQPTTPKSNFAVVDTYKGCDVVQWTNGSLATYKYFFDCNNTRPVYGEK